MSTPPRVVLLTSPSVFGAVIINEIAATKGLNLVGVGLTDRVFKNKGLLATLRTLLKRMGWRYTGYNIQIANIAWIKLQLSGRPRGLRSVKKNVRYLKDVNAPATLAWLRELQPDYVASFYFNQWIGPEVRLIPAQACVNLHPSLLPALRGPDPAFRTLERGLETSGLTLHTVADGFDDGAILHQVERPVLAGISHFGFYLQQVRDGARILAQWLSGQLAGQTRQLGDAAQAEDYTTFPTPAEVDAFLKNGHVLLGRGELRRALKAVD